MTACEGANIQEGEACVGCQRLSVPPETTDALTISRSR